MTWLNEHKINIFKSIFLEKCWEFTFACLIMYQTISNRFWFVHPSMPFIMTFFSESIAKKFMIFEWDLDSNIRNHNHIAMLLYSCQVILYLPLLEFSNISNNLTNTLSCKYHHIYWIISKGYISSPTLPSIWTHLSTNKICIMNLRSLGPSPFLAKGNWVFAIPQARCTHTKWLIVKLC